MADNETITDIIAEKRRQANKIELDCAEKMKRSEMISDQYARELVADIRREADRLEAAHRRERGDAAKLRKALEAIGGLCDRLIPTWAGAIGRIKDVAEIALAAPPRNCDVGTAEEQSERMDAAYCSKRLCAKGKCPLFKPGLDCSLIWAQMPYEEGGDK